jgi:tRNA wybutosine-synthesizing protein 1
MVAKELKKLLEKQQYGFCGEHSAVKICGWTKKSLVDRGVCYKEQFYGIRAHLCCQMSPSVGFCQNNCVICWRDQAWTEGTDSVKVTQNNKLLDNPKDIVDNSVIEQRKLITGYGGNAKANLQKFEEAQEPMHYAISLTGEPTLYPKLNELIKELHDRGKTTFLVSNGLKPDVIRNLEMPTQLYISLDAPTKQLWEKIDNSCVKDGWEKLMETMDVLKELKDKTRTTIRITLIKNINMCDAKEYANIIERADAKFIEVKAYMFVGSSQERLKIENMPTHEEVYDFSKEICKYCDYKIIDDKKESRVVLLAREDSPDRIMKFE